MAIFRNTTLLFLLLISPSYLFGAERDGSPVAQVQLPQDVTVEQTRAAEGPRVAEAQNHLPLTPEAQRAGAANAGDVAVFNPSNPVAAKAVDRNISLFSDRIRERFSIWLLRSGKYLELMKAILKEKSMPEDIAFLPFIESGFNPNAYSVARAVGPWQFIASTGKRYGLKIDWWRDERKDPVKSTHAAANYLKDLYEMFGSWNLAMAAYNAGEGKILRAMNRSRSDNYWDLLNTRYIKKETKEYVPRFIAAKLIATDPHNYGFVDQQYHSPFTYDEVVIEKPLDLGIAAECAETTLEAVRELNPELRRWSTPPDVPSYTLRIPHGKKDLFMRNLAKVPDEERFALTPYVAKKGDSIKKISTRTGVPVNVLLDLNDDRGLKPLKAGEVIYLPPKEKFALDQDDRAEVKKASLKGKKARGKKNAPKKIIVTSLSKKQSYVND
jgi:membrane-bound lytic murein transglycosylase D